MPDENTNPEEGQVLSSDEATDEALTLEQLQSKKPDEILELYNNSREAIKAATQRNMETAEERKRLEAERDYWLQERQRKDAELQQLRDQYVQLNKLAQQAGQQPQPSPRSYEELTPDQAYAQLLDEQRKTQSRIEAIEKRQQEDIQKVFGEVQKTQSSIKYEKFLEKEIFPKYEYVTESKLDDWFTAHPTINPDPKTVHFAAGEIQKAEDAVIEARVQARLKAKAERAKEAAIAESGAPLAALPGDVKFIDMTPAQQMEQIARDVERSQGK